jgi:hypothetical protein
MYDPTVGKWISADPISFKGEDTNLYRYAGNSPVQYSDWSGLKQGTGKYCECGDDGMPWKNVNVELIVFHGAVVDTDEITETTNDLLEQCCIQINTSVTMWDETKTNSVTGGASTLSTIRSHDRRFPSAFIKKITDEQGEIDPDRIYAYLTNAQLTQATKEIYGDAFSPNDTQRQGQGFPTNGLVVGNNMLSNSLAHELYHMLSPDPYYHLMPYNLEIYDYDPSDIDEIVGPYVMAAKGSTEGAIFLEKECDGIRMSDFLNDSSISEEDCEQ